MKETRSITLILAVGLLLSGVVKAELVGWWKLDGGPADSSGYGHDGVLFGDPEWVTGMIGGALKCDGVNDRVEIPGTSAAEGFAGLEGEVTWTMWMKASASGAIQTIMAMGPAGGAHVQGNRSVNVEVSGVIMVRAHSVGALTSLNSTAVVNDDEWHHIAVTIAFETDGANDSMKVYIDGDPAEGYETDAVDINQHAGVAADFVVTLGYRAGSPFGGTIDDVRIYDRALTTDEIRVLIESGGEPYPFAYGPMPANGSMIEQTVTMLKWMPGDFAASHNLYFGTSFEDVNAATPENQDVFLGATVADSQFVGVPEALAPGATYYWRVDEVNDANPESPWKGDVWSFWVRPAIAWSPTPGDAVKFVLPDQDLSWEAGTGTLFHTVYFGESFDEVNDADAGGWMIVDTVYDPGPLALDTTYYWRVDEFVGTGTNRGDVWSFTTLPEVAITDPDLVLWYNLDEGMGTTAADWSGHEHHAMLVGPQWVPAGWLGDAALRLTGYGAIQALQYDTNDIPEVTVCSWIQTANAGDQYIVSFDRNEYYRLEINGSGGGPGQVGWDVWTSTGQVDYGSVTRVDDGQWHHVCGVFDNGTLTIYIDGQPEPSAVGGPVMGTGNVRFGFLGANSEATAFDGTRGGGSALSGLLDDVRIYNTALTQEEIQAVMRPDLQLAWQPSPGSGATTDVTQALPLAWQAGDGAAQHDVYLSSDRETLIAADATDATGVYRGRQSVSSFSPDAPLAWGQEYYWRVDEVAADGTVAHGTIWGFTLTDFLIVDNFEGYTNNSPNRVFQHWIDGLGFSPDEHFPDGNPGNGSGAIVGYDPTMGNIMEMTLVHDGGQSMPIEYDNSFAPGYSEALRTFSSAQDWTREGVTTLVVHFRGMTDNTDKLYVKINGTKVPYPGDPADIASSAWVTWEIDLTSVGVALTDVTQLAIGVEGDGTGLLYVDDIRLTRAKSAIADE
jgi:hypothetical protein